MPRLDELTVDDREDADANQYDVTSQMVYRNGVLVANYYNMARLNIDAGPHQDLVNVTSSAPGTPVYLAGGAGSDTLTGTNQINFFLLDGIDAGIMSCCGSQIGFTSFENLLGQAGRDTVVFRSAGQLTGTFAGGDGIDTLDYTGFGAPVVVNLVLGTATGVAGGISAVENVMGGAWDDILVGDANSNSLSGGGGRDLLIGGDDGDYLAGGDGDDILLAGTTLYDDDLAALSTLRDEWVRDLPYAERVDHLMNGGGLNDPYRLDLFSVFPDHLFNTLLGDLDLDWFFAHEHDPTDWNGELGEQLVLLSQIVPEIDQ